jgi:hypothetical protein
MQELDWDRSLAHSNDRRPTAGETKPFLVTTVSLNLDWHCRPCTGTINPLLGI